MSRVPWSARPELEAKLKELVGRFSKSDQTTPKAVKMSKDVWEHIAHEICKMPGGNRAAWDGVKAKFIRLVQSEEKSKAKALRKAKAPAKVSIDVDDDVVEDPAKLASDLKQVAGLADLVAKLLPKRQRAVLEYCLDEELADVTAIPELEAYSPGFVDGLMHRTGLAKSSALLFKARIHALTNQ